MYRLQVSDSQDQHLPPSDRISNEYQTADPLPGRDPNLGFRSLGRVLGFSI